MKIARPNFEVVYNDSASFSMNKAMNDWFDEHVEPLNKMLAEGVELYGSETRPLDGWNQKSYESSTHKALLINSEPIKEKSREEKMTKLLSDIASLVHSTYSSSFAEPLDYEDLKPLMKRADKLLSEKP